MDHYIAKEPGVEAISTDVKCKLFVGEQTR